MKEALEEIRAAARTALAEAGDESAVEAVRVRFLGRKGELTTVVRLMRDVPADERPAMGALLNAVKDEVETRLDEALTTARSRARSQAASERIDVTAPGRRPQLGRAHPLMQVMHEIIDVFFLGAAAAAST